MVLFASVFASQVASGDLLHDNASVLDFKMTGLRNAEESDAKIQQVACRASEQDAIINQVEAEVPNLMKWCQMSTAIYKNEALLLCGTPTTPSNSPTVC